MLTKRTTLTLMTETKVQDNTIYVNNQMMKAHEYVMMKRLALVATRALMTDR